MLLITVDDLSESSDDMTKQIEGLSEKASNGASANINEEQLQEMMTKLQGGPNLINIEMRLSTIEVCIFSRAVEKTAISEQSLRNEPKK